MAQVEAAWVVAMVVAMVAEKVAAGEVETVGGETVVEKEAAVTAETLQLMLKRLQLIQTKME